MRRKGLPIHGWLVLDKPLGMSSSRAVGVVRRLLGAAKAGHGGTLDPLATGVLPIALGEATKTVSFAMAGPKAYRFALRWGEARATDDAEGAITASSDVRPSREAIEAVLPRFTGRVMQVPPTYSAIKIEGRRAYALARADVTVELAPRPVEIKALRLLRAEGQEAELEAEVGKGTYIRALGRDLAQALGTLAYVSALRRTRVGPFREAQALKLDVAEHLAVKGALSEHLLPVETALDDIPALALTAEEGDRMRCGQAVTPGIPQHLAPGTIVRAVSGGRFIALAEVDAERLRPVRVMNL
jgi:tRNA pseudouridine55 synthase